MKNCDNAQGIIHGYKVFGPDWTCRGFQYEIGKTYGMYDMPVCCEKGFHFCKKLADCFSYYSFSPQNKVAEVIALGEVDYKNDDIKCCTNKIEIVREIPWDEVLRIVNTGSCNTGNRNTGNCNSGDRNSGDRNTGNWNSGGRNTGNCNSGGRNSGDRNTGDCNTGDWNSGDRNTGNCNSGGRNSGDRNTGDCNTGNWNSGDRNTGNWNSGDRNTGNWNSGDRNTGNWNSGGRNSGDRNTGNWNSGDRNTGDWNKSSFNTGCFMTEGQKISMFNKSSDWTYGDWMDSNARVLLGQIPKTVVEWIYSEDMTDEEKAEHRTHETAGGYLKVLDESECGQLWWDGLSADEKLIITTLPNFNPEIFRKCTGIEIDK